jgi:hypothetical protein
MRQGRKRSIICNYSALLEARRPGMHAAGKINRNHFDYSTPRGIYVLGTHTAGRETADILLHYLRHAHLGCMEQGRRFQSNPHWLGHAYWVRIGRGGKRQMMHDYSTPAWNAY